MLSLPSRSSSHFAPTMVMQHERHLGRRTAARCRRRRPGDAVDAAALQQSVDALLVAFALRLWNTCAASVAIALSASGRAISRCAV